MPQKWLIKKPVPSDWQKKFPAYGGIILQLLYDRGLDTEEKIEEFFKPDFTQDLHDPFLFKDMKIAVERIKQAIAKQEKILIYGDYDADGVIATVVVEKSLKKLGAKYVAIYIPHRDIEGYGLNNLVVQKIIADKIDLVITVDCGITNLEAIAELKKNKIDTIITDHHLAGEKLPEALAILDCSLQNEPYPFKKLAGVGVAYKLSQALFLSAENPEQYLAFEKWLLDLVAIGTIGDVSPILGENRTLVSYGLKVLNKTPRKGLQELIRVSSLSNGDELKDLPLGSILYDLDVRNISFQLVPRINAAGRIDHANLAYNLLTTEDELEAIALARDIQEKNLERQKIAEQMLMEVEESLKTLDDKEKIIIIFNKNWLHGLLGLVAGKLKDKYNRPIILFTLNNGIMAGSGRSIKEFNITEALGQCSEFLERFGGHSQACGLGIKGEANYQKFVEKIKKLASEKLKDVELIPTLEIDAEVNLKDLDWQLIDDLKKFEPFAEANPAPLFLVKNLEIVDMTTVGKEGKHLRFQLKQNNLIRKAISFGTALEWGSQIKVGDIIDAVLELGVNEWNGSRELQLKVIDFKGCHPERLAKDPVLS
ncbi:MAG TPA: single-stranded-DNA-specific exonuclease RecJ [bacterium]|nr:single-stranded-DNA-specific exonuclease RecJ [bacterium]HPL95472.1 single-stranded-DNA-specific exonuclease RecJ [bacterium]